MDITPLPSDVDAAVTSDNGAAGSPPRQYSAPAVRLACRMLRHLGAHRQGQATLTELANEADTNKTTALRVLRTLEREGFVTYDDTAKKFSLGAYLFVLGNRAAERSGVLSVALPALPDAARDTGYTCVLVQREDSGHLTFLAGEEPDNPVRVSVMTGRRFRITAGSHGKVFLAHMAAEDAEDVVRRVGLPRHAAALTSTEEYLAGLLAVRREGYAVSVEEHVPGIFGIAAPVYDAAGEVLLTLSAIGVAAALDDAETRRVGTILARRAAAVSRALGWRPEEAAG